MKNYHEKVAEFVEQRLAKFKEYAEVYWELVPFEPTKYETIDNQGWRVPFERQDMIVLDKPDQFWEMLKTLKSMCWVNNGFAKDSKRPLQFWAVFPHLQYQIVKAITRDGSFYQLRSDWKDYELQKEQSEMKDE